MKSTPREHHWRSAFLRLAQAKVQAPELTSGALTQPSQGCCCWGLALVGSRPGSHYWLKAALWLLTDIAQHNSFSLQTVCQCTLLNKNIYSCSTKFLGFCNFYSRIQNHPSTLNLHFQEHAAFPPLLWRKSYHSYYWKTGKKGSTYLGPLLLLGSYSSSPFLFPIPSPQ